MVGESGRMIPFEDRYRVMPNGCWEWILPLSDGYGRHCRRLAHRVSYERVNGPIPQGKQVCHSCDNRKCVNPEHLWLGTNADNMRDKADKGRVRGERNPRAKLTAQQASEIKRLRGKLAGKILASRFGVSVATVFMIHSGRLWGHVD